MKDKKVIIIISIIVILLILIGGYLIWKSKSNNTESIIKQQEFSEEDLKIGEIDYKTSQSQLIQKLGEAEAKKEHMDGTTGDKIIEYLYNNEKTSYVFRDIGDGSEAKLSQVTSTTNKDTFSRNLKIGSTKQEVLQAYPENTKLGSETKIEYTKGEKGKENFTVITYKLKNDIVTEINWTIE